MRQLLLRVPEDLHARLTRRAAREQRSLNAIATEILDAAADADAAAGADRGTRLRAQAAAAGSLQRLTAAPRVSAARRQTIIATTRGLGPQVDQQLAHERELP